MSTIDSGVDNLVELAQRRYEVVSKGDIDAIMALLCDDPVFELYPIGLKLAGKENVRRYYHHFCETVTPQLEATPVGSPFLSSSAIGFEMDMVRQGANSVREEFRVLALMNAEGGKFTGERLYASEGLFRLMFGGPIWSLLTPIE